MSSLLATDQKRKTLTPKHLEYAIDRINSATRAATRP